MIDDKRLNITWEDGHKSVFSLRYLEDLLSINDLPISQAPYLTKDSDIPEVCWVNIINRVVV